MSHLLLLYWWNRVIGFLFIFSQSFLSRIKKNMLVLTPNSLSISKCVFSFCVPGNHYHLPVCCWRTAALHAVPAPGRSSNPQTWPVHAATAQWGGLWGNHANTCIYSISYECDVLELIFSFCMCVFRRCVRRWTPRPEETQCWSVSREHSSAGKSRSRNSARLFLTATRCLVKPYRWPQARVRVGTISGLSALTLSPAALSLTSSSLLCTAPSE